MSGYTKSVDPIESWAFEIMYLTMMSKILETKNVNAGTLGTLNERIGSKPEYSGLAKKLGFKMIYE